MIRQYSEKDFDGIVKLIQSIQDTDCWPLVYPNGWDIKKIKEEFEPMDNYQDSLFLVSESDGALTGLIAGHDLASFIRDEIPHLKNKFEEQDLVNPNVFYKRDIMIHPEYQRGFVGFRLVKELQNHASNRNYTRLVTRTPPLNLRGINFFEKLGYVPIFTDNNPERIYFKKTCKF
jgi:GNAT superfamily N-acetyltransferase